MHHFQKRYPIQYEDTRYAGKKRKKGVFLFWLSSAGINVRGSTDITLKGVAPLFRRYSSPERQRSHIFYCSLKNIATHYSHTIIMDPWSEVRVWEKLYFRWSFGIAHFCIFCLLDENRSRRPTTCYITQGSAYQNGAVGLHHKDWSITTKSATTAETLSRVFGKLYISPGYRRP
jgi:hypothetical protein